jgi:tRNA A-37 threonylcarbamoyl transferase component Bud32
MRFVFSPPAGKAAGLLTLPWELPLDEWQDERLVEVRQRGLSRHVVRFVSDSGELYALKSISELLARREYRLLRALADLAVPAVQVVGIVVDRGRDMDAILVTRFLDYASTYRAVFSRPRGAPPTDRLLDALVELLARLHLSGFFWGDCSLSNALFRADAGAFEAYLVDTETSEQHPTLTDGQRGLDLDIAMERVRGELMDLQAGELLSADLDPIDISEELGRRYQRLWHELTREEILQPAEQRYRIADRLRCLNDLGFDADEVELIPSAAGTRLRVRTKVAESGQSSRELFQQTGISAEEHQAQRLLNDIASFRAYLEQRDGSPVSQTLAAHRWLEHVYDPVVASVPDRLRDRLAPPEIFHEILEHRWYMSEAAGRDVGTTAAAQSYFATELPSVPPQVAALDEDADGSVRQPQGQEA